MEFEYLGTLLPVSSRLQGGDGMPRDPVCGMDVKDDKKSIRSDFRGQTYHFCSDRCKSTFDQDPQNFASPGDDNRPDGQGRNRNRDNRPLR